MPRRTDISSSLVTGAGLTPSPRRGEGWGEGVRNQSATAGVRPPHPALSRRGEGLSGVLSPGGEGSFGAVPRDQELLADGLEDAVGVSQDIVVPEAENSVAVV